MNKIKKLRLYIVSLLLSAFALSSCIVEDLTLGNSAGESEITIIIDMPGTAASRAIGSTDDAVIDRIDVLLFDSDNGSRYVGRVSPVFGINQTSQSFTVKVPKGNLELAIFANSKDIIDAATFTVGTTTKAEAYESLTESLPFNNIWNADPQDPGYKPFPMWGEVIIDTNTATTVSVTLVRALAKINIRFLNPTISSKLEITEISLYNYHTNGYLASWASPNTPTHISNKREGYANGIYFSSTLIDNNQMMDEIFLFEVAPPANPSNPAVADRVASTCIIIRGHFEGSAEDSYYRVDLKSPAGVYYGVTRNNNYDIVIQDVLGPGANTGEIAYDSELVDITATVLQWDLGAEMDVDYSGQYRLVTSSSEFLMNRTGGIAGQQTLKILSTHPDGWEVDESGLPDWITLSITQSNNITGFVDMVITCEPNPYPVLRAVEFYIETALLRKKITVMQNSAPSGNMWAPPGVLGVTADGRLTLRGSSHYSVNTGIAAYAQSEFGGLEAESVWMVYFKFGSVVGMHNRGPLASSGFNAGEIAWGPAEYDLESLISNIHAIDISNPNLSAQQARYSLVPDVRNRTDGIANGAGAAFPQNTSANLAAGVGDPCALADAGTSTYTWVLPMGSPWNGDASLTLLIANAGVAGAGLPSGRYTADWTMFLPTSGNRGGSVGNSGAAQTGEYWSNPFDSSPVPGSATRLYFTYTVMTVNGSGPFNQGNAIRCVLPVTQINPSSMDICPNEDNVISLTAATGQSGITYRWETSTDNTAWVPAPTPNNNQNYDIAAFALTENTYFRRVAIWAGTEFPTASALISVPLGTFPQTSVNIGGIIWSTRNLDLSTSSGFTNHPSEWGMFFQYNRNTGWHPTDATNPRAWSTGSSSWVTQTWNGTEDTGTAWLTPANDPCPAGWRLPIQAEFNTLLSSSAIGSDGQRGQWITAAQASALGLGCTPGRIFGPGANATSFDPATQLFLPAAGYRSNASGTLSTQGSNGYYWSSTPDGTPNAWLLYFHSNNAYESNLNRTNGFSVRCISL